MLYLHATTVEFQTLVTRYHDKFCERINMKEAFCVHAVIRGMRKLTNLLKNL